MYQPMDRNILAGFNCTECNKVFKTDADLKKHKRRVHVGKSYHCSDCDFTSGWLESLKRHKKQMHGDAKHQASPTVKAPMPLHLPVSCREVQTQTNPLQVGNPYLTRDVGTQYPEYADSMVSEMESDNSITDSESDTSSVVSDIDINLKSLLSELEKVLNVNAHLFQEQKTQKNK